MDAVAIQTLWMGSILEQKEQEVWRVGFNSGSGGDRLGHPEQIMWLS